ncbi:MAG: hypothetical protein NVSMB57_04890 [Actinomycetota bacterium]
MGGDVRMTRLIEIREVAVERTHAIRRETLRDGLPDQPVTHPDDERSDAFHLMALVGDVDAGVVSCAPGAVPQGAIHAGADAWRLYQMGVTAQARRSGIGRALIQGVVDRVRSRGGEILWAMARDSALDFYSACGFVISGDGYPGWREIPHHSVVLQL